MLALVKAFLKAGVLVETGDREDACTALTCVSGKGGCEAGLNRPPSGAINLAVYRH